MTEGSVSEPRKSSQSRRVKTLNISLDPAHRRYLEQRAHDERRSLAWVVNEMIRREMVEAEVQRAMQERMSA